MKRQQKIKALLMSVGAETNSDAVATAEIFLSFIDTRYLKHFTEYVLKNYDKYKKPFVNITTASQEYKKHLKLKMIRDGTAKMKTVEEVRDFLYEYFKGQAIANRVDGLYLPFTTISLTEKGQFFNNYSKEILDSQDEQIFLYWCFKHQEKIGVIYVLPISDLPKLEHSQAKGLLSLEEVSQQYKNDLSQKEIVNKDGKTLPLCVKRI